MEPGDDQDDNAVTVHSGFPNPADDRSLGSLDLQQLLVTRPISTFLFRIRGHNWESLGIFDSDIAIVDRTPYPTPNDLAIWWGEQGVCSISQFRDIPKSATIWGVVTAIIHQYRKTRQ
ncbi:MAG TPA: S24 family peptidase [Candidatus Saccharimonadales bacterium]|nr:S24 family peptidase [Candidatus Saccharimonadales bacterium]